MVRAGGVGGVGGYLGGLCCFGSLVKIYFRVIRDIK